MSLGDLIHLFAALKRGGGAAGVLEGRNDVDQFYVGGFGDQLFQRVNANAVIVHGDAHRFGTARAECVECADEAGVLAEHHVAGVTKNATAKLKTLLTTRGDDGGIEIAADGKFIFLTLGNGLTKGGEALGNAVLKRRGGAVGKNIRGKTGKLLYGEGLGSGIARGKGNDGGIGEAFENLTDGRRLKLFEAVGKMIFHIGSPLWFVRGVQTK